MAIITAPANLVLNGTVGVPFSANTPNATYSPGGSYMTEYFVLSGTLAPGVTTFNPAQNTPFSNALPFLNNFLTGTPSMAGTFVFILQWFESGVPLDFSNQQITINIDPDPNPPITPKKKRGIGAPQTFCCDPKQFPNGCPDQLRTTNGNQYVKIGDNCYALIRRRR